MADQNGTNPTTSPDDGRNAEQSRITVGEFVHAVERAYEQTHSPDDADDNSITTFDCHCWAPVTPDGGIIPWLCRTDPQEIERELRFLKRNDWTVKRVRITADE